MILTIYPSIDVFYAEDSRRRFSRESDYGVMWRENGSWPEFRVSYVKDTGEVYAICLGGPQAGEVQVLGVVEPIKTAYDDFDVAWDAPLDEVLNGWPEVCSQPESLKWVRHRLAPYRKEDA